MTSLDWPAVQPITTDRLDLEPLRVDHADELAPALDDRALHTYIGGEPATVAQLGERFTHQVVGHSTDGTEGWFNWVARHRTTGSVVGTVQATLTRADDQLVAEIAWTIGVPWQGQGYAVEAATAMADWLRAHGVAVLIAHVHPDHLASIGVARRLGLEPTDIEVDGENRWTTPTRD